jgi:periplasmic protein TonB
MVTGNTMNASALNVMSAFAAQSNFAPRTIILAVVLSAHLAVFSAWSLHQVAEFPVVNEMAVSFAMTTQTHTPDVARKTKVIPPPRPLPEQEPEHLPSAESQQTNAAPAPAVSPEPAPVPDTEPDYKASYLNNPPPVYPMAARRMGMQGKVMLNVEVLAGGMCGQITIQKSSGFAMLDNAALQTVRTWRFLPARQAGRAVDKWFMIPIQFYLKDNAA